VSPWQIGYEHDVALHGDVLSRSIDTRAINIEPHLKGLRSADIQLEAVDGNYSDHEFELLRPFTKEV